MSVVFNVMVSALIIGFTSWLAGRFPVTAGFLVALPLVSLLVIPLTYLQHGDPENAVILARSILVAVPISLLFFVPFVFYDRGLFSFWQTYVLGIALLVLGYGVHRVVTRALFGGS